MDAQRLGDQIADPPARVERGIGVLEHHLHLGAGSGRSGAAPQTRDVDAVELELARR